MEKKAQNLVASLGGMHRCVAVVVVDVECVTTYACAVFVDDVLY